MLTFLQNTAQDLHARYGESMGERTLVFPGKRAQLYFFEHWAQIAQQPIAQPNCTTLPDIFAEISGLQPADHYQLLTMLYKAHREFQPRQESFDRFYFWGEMMLNDFDTIDKHLVPVAKLFANLRADKQMDSSWDFLSHDQQALVRSFWSSFSPDSFSPAGNGTPESNFVDLWSALLPTYQTFGAQLQAQHLGYAGLQSRRAAEMLDTHGYDFGPRHFVFIGFNALNACEKALFHYLKKQARAEFYWDYDRYYTANTLQEAGHFMRYNLQHFPSPEAESAPIANFFEQHKDIAIVAAPSDALQTKLLPQMLDEVRGAKPLEALERDTAIVLIDEGLLIPVLYALPPEIAALNVTMGYPLQQTPVFGLVELFVRLHKNARATNGATPRFYHKDVLALLQHQYMKMLAPEPMAALCKEIISNNRVYVEANFFEQLPVAELRQLFLPELNPLRLCAQLNQLLALIAGGEWLQNTAESHLRSEYIACAHRAITRLNQALQASDLELSLSVFLSLLRNALKGIRIPFEGDPIEGVQIMGVLETLSLDFQNVIILSLNEDVFSHSGNATSLIPYNLRRAFGLPTSEQQDALYAYYFYRLLQRAQRIRLLYNSQSGNRRSGEMSRYLRQLQMESPHNPPLRTVSYSVAYRDTPPIAIAKSEEVMRLLQQFLHGGERAFSATALQKFLACPLKFYFAEIARIQEPATVEEEINGKMLGNIYHHSMHLLYRPFERRQVSAETLQALLRDRSRIAELVLQQTAAEYFGSTAAAAEMDAVQSNGKLWLAQQTAQKYVQQTLSFDARRAPFMVEGLEMSIKSTLSVHLHSGPQQVQLKGYIDRLDRNAGALCVIDYKTGSFAESKVKFHSVEDLFGDHRQRRSEIFQTLLYALMLQRQHPGAVLEPALYFLRNIYRADYHPSIKQKTERGYAPLTDAVPLLPSFEAHLQSLLATIFDPQHPFAQTPERENCEFCPYADICSRQ